MRLTADEDWYRNGIKANGVLSCGMPYTYDELCAKLIEHGCKMITPEEEWAQRRMRVSHDKYRYVATCGHDHESYLHNLFSRGSGKLCTACVNKHMSKLVKTRLQNGENGNATEANAIKLIKDILFPGMTVEKTNEGCRADMIVKPSTETADKWMGIQVKSTQTSIKSYEFRFAHNDYENLIVICVSVPDQLFWVFDGKELTLQKIYISKHNCSKYDKHTVLKEQLYSTVHNWYATKPLFAKSVLMTPQGLPQQKEHMYRLKRLHHCPFLMFEEPDIQSQPYDFIVNGKRVQEKVGTLYRRKIVFTLHKHNGRNHNRAYEVGDAELYWLHVPDTTKDYIIPEHILHKHGYISAKGIIQKPKMLRMNADNLMLFDGYLYDYTNSDDLVRLQKLFEL